MDERIRKPILKLAVRKKDVPVPNVEDEDTQLSPDFTQELIPEWDIPIIPDVEPKQRKRRKDKHTHRRESMRKDARWN